MVSATHASKAAAGAAGIDFDRKFVRVVERRPDGFVAFDFAIGEPEIYAEMLLPAAAFEEFCVANAAIPLEGAPCSGDGQDDDFLWRLSDAARAAAGEATPSDKNAQERSH